MKMARGGRKDPKDTPLATEVGAMELKGKRVAVLVENIYEDLELWYPVLRMREAGADVTIVGTGAPVYTSKHGY
ncbi:MAG: DJ-1/PfpI family protein, partial [Verrucomicrobiota bacterium]